MPVPRLFEAAHEPREQWVHVLATLLALGGPETRAALVAELLDDPIAGTAEMLVSEQRPMGTGPGVALADIVVRSGSDWAVVIESDLAFDVPRADRLIASYDAVAGSVERCVLIAITPDRRPPADIAAIGGGRDVRHKSWLRVRDWVQERPERGAATGVDLALLREADYFFTPRVAELYRLESLMPMVDTGLRHTLASVFFDMHDLSSAPTILNPTDSSALLRYPRTGDTAVQLALGNGPPRMTLTGGAAGPGYDGEALVISAPQTYTAARAWTHAEARRLLPARR